MKIVRVFTTLAALTALSACAASPSMESSAPVVSTQSAVAPVTSAAPPPPPPVVAAPVEMEAQPLVVYFGLNKSDISASTMQVLHGAAPALKAAQPSVIRIHGFTDSAGKSSYNRMLSEKRAQAVADQLRKLGIVAAKVEVVGFGSDKSTTARKGKHKEARDRRVEITWEPQAKSAAVDIPQTSAESPASDGATLTAASDPVTGVLAGSGPEATLPAVTDAASAASAWIAAIAPMGERVADLPPVRGPPLHPLT
ncbi:hypothetical protein A6A04_08815 [Paramagnetospirillum marisnigri]|uniref:OmpA-like domain-containing protein n=1 Tax=Paramagnetospirillum marisnigri TaxID=1285242 RepID=A0A178M7V5_9PROT|nr:OmpA family protein [Paramagnetospirillum marisnigri]OAN43974.1 hypothetical protein A6A04_08815 [Paramagnetospirillum marisnigri]